MGTQTVAVSGASGLVGGKLVGLLKSAGHTVLPISRRSADSSTILWEAERGFLNPARLEGVDAIVHLAGENIAAGRWSPAQKQKIRDSRVQGTRTLVESLRGLSNRPKTLVCASAIGFYGDRGEEVLDEQSTAGTGFLPDVCREWEAAAHVVPHDRVRVTTLRTGIVMSAAGGALKKQLPLFRLGVGGRLGNGQQWMSPISLRDTVSAIIHVLVNDIVGPVNLVAPEPARNSEVTQAIARAVQRPALLPVPKFALAAVLAARWWWLGRKLRKAQQAEQADVVEGEYRVVGAEVIEAAVIEQPPQRRE